MGTPCRASAADGGEGAGLSQWGACGRLGASCPRSASRARWAAPSPSAPCGMFPPPPPRAAGPPRAVRRSLTTRRKRVGTVLAFSQTDSARLTKPAHPVCHGLWCWSEGRCRNRGGARGDGLTGGEGQVGVLRVAGEHGHHQRGHLRHDLRPRRRHLHHQRPPFRSAPPPPPLFPFRRRRAAMHARAEMDRGSWSASRLHERSRAAGLALARVGAEAGARGGAGRDGGAGYSQVPGRGTEPSDPKNTYV